MVIIAFTPSKEASGTVTVNTKHIAFHNPDFNLHNLNANPDPDTDLNVG